MKEHLSHGGVILFQFVETGSVWDEAEAARNGKIVFRGGGSEVDGLVLHDSFAEFGISKGTVRDFAGGDPREVVIVPGVTGRHGLVRWAVTLGVEEGCFFPEGAFGGEDFDRGRSHEGLVKSLAKIG